MCIDLISFEVVVFFVVIFIHKKNSASKLLSVCVCVCEAHSEQRHVSVATQSGLITVSVATVLFLSFTHHL